MIVTSPTGEINTYNSVKRVKGAIKFSHDTFSEIRLWLTKSLCELMR